MTSPRKRAAAPERPDYMVSFIQLHDICDDRFNFLPGDEGNAIGAELRAGAYDLWQSWPQRHQPDDPEGRVRAIRRLVAALGRAAAFAPDERPNALAHESVRAVDVSEGLAHAANLLSFHCDNPAANPRAVRPRRGRVGGAP